MANTQSKNDELEEQISKLIVENTDLKKKLANAEARNDELKQIIEENIKRDDRIKELEQKNMELETRFAILEQGSTVDGQPQNNSRDKSAGTKKAELSSFPTQLPLLSKNASDEAKSEEVSAVVVADSQVVRLEHYKPDCKINDAVPFINSKTTEDIAIDEFLGEVHKKRVSDSIRQRKHEEKLRAQDSLPEEERPQDLDSDAQLRNSTSSEVLANSDASTVPPEGKTYNETNSKCKKSVGKLKQELFTPELSSQEPTIDQNHVTEISETLCPGKVTSGDNSSLDETSQHLAQLCDSAFDAEDRANRANQKEILCWSLYAKDFRIQLNGIIENSESKIGEKKARSLLYDSITEQLNLLRRQRSQELGLQLRNISRDSLRKKTQRAEKVYKFFEKVGLDKIGYVKSYSATSISELTDE
ncbi:hypothetical protein Glove_73g7 [Diversispora epigaea]|uniref:Uncharacterized protein n=1 Tax=Diversispora epigaea TaxID=1348612 RepID=A0A397J9K7_9GLOM|nr:hypothetical protein Glove_73g7 [Diversispora epigaea]